MSTAAQSPYKIQVLTSLETHEFVKPTKKINDERDVSTFHTSGAYRDICLLILQLNMAMCPRKPSATLEECQTWKLDAPIELQQPVRQLQQLLQRCNDIIDEVPPDTGPRRFGNASFRKWHEVLELRARSLLQEYLPPSVLNCGSSSGSGDDEKVSVLDELTPYFMGSFGSSQRLDYGTGHELSFLAFLGCLWKLGGFSDEEAETMTTSRNIVIGVMEPCVFPGLQDPAGSHGVWGLDDHSFIPYIFGSSQYCPAIDENEAMPEEGSYPDTPSPTGISKKPIVDREREHNMFFSAVGFINDVKTGPFWEHSPMLFDISGIRAGWGKINKGMIKMYNAEVLSKFPVSGLTHWYGSYSRRLGDTAFSIWLIVYMGSRATNRDYRRTELSAKQISNGSSSNLGVSCGKSSRRKTKLLDKQHKAPKRKWSNELLCGIGEE
ncbi:serine/threonine-protein phosphatase 2A activator 1 [Blumeria hordei DH14]|uniref:Serine/threonine-protein phosphatase 2A activator n=1 Tax=Blumeria graminis f. sp. hordei (strain DH14) TaxID=546991 RepID=N1JMH2_BLUG1|nr:serine/threonine-protein phosphatase 2A activator 1 [Blumeria hordei DH14]